MLRGGEDLRTMVMLLCECIGGGDTQALLVLKKSNFCTLRQWGCKIVGRKCFQPGAYANELSGEILIFTQIYILSITIGESKGAPGTRAPT